MTDEEIAAHYKAGTLVAALLEPIDTSAQTAIRGQLARLHNSGDIDMLALAAATAISELGPRRYVMQQVYKDVLPLLEAAPDVMRTTVERLIEQSGKDGMAPLFQDAHRKWLEGDAERARPIVVAAEIEADIDRQMLLDALTVLSNLEIAKSFLRFQDGRRQAAIAALGHIDPRNEKTADEILELLLGILVSDPNDDMRFTAIFASFNVLKRAAAIATSWTPRIIDAVAAAPTQGTLTALLQGLWRNNDFFSASDAGATLRLASEGDIASPGLKGTLDGTLSQLIGSALHEQAVDCLTSLVMRTDGAFELTENSGLTHRLRALDRARLFTLSWRWFATGNDRLCQAMATLIGTVGQRIVFDATFAGTGLTGSEMIVLCHKAIAFMFLAPEVSTPFVIAALRVGDKKNEKDFVDLLFQTILVNFPEFGVAYLKALSHKDSAYKPARKALTLYRKYSAGLELESPIKELWPSSSQRRAVHQKQFEMSREIMKQAQQQSVFLSMVQRSTILYGRKSMAYIHGPDKPPVTIEMKSMGANMQMPRLEVIDPVGFDYLMRIFRGSQPI